MQAPLTSLARRLADARRAAILDRLAVASGKNPRADADLDRYLDHVSRVIDAMGRGEVVHHHVRTTSRGRVMSDVTAPLE